MKATCVNDIFSKNNLMRPDRQTDTSRIEGFSDAVFAFAATLLVVSLEVPRSFAALLTQLKGFGAFAITFGALALIWSVHRAFFRRYALNDGITVFLNCGLLFVVLFYVFPLKFLTESWFSHLVAENQENVISISPDELKQVFALYSVGFSSIFFFLTLMYANAWRLREWQNLSPTAAWEAAMQARHYGCFVVVGILSITVALLGWGIEFGLPGLVYFLIGPACLVHGLWSERFKPKE